ncbi:MAG TPA: DNA-deoxyinosine glycosylase, partial [Clostridiales bacterium]|nr:DNA-deoxyinosine glycosylase [Clostridiales bacterium]
GGDFMPIIYGLAPVIKINTEILLVGTLPGTLSLQTRKYYADPRNNFWRILERIYKEDMPSDYPSRCTYLLNRKIGIWDVLKCAYREGATDKRISNAIINDYKAMVTHYPSLRKIVILGTTADKYYEKGIRQSKIPQDLQHIIVQSSSPTPGKNVLLLDQKIIQWKTAILSSE